MDADTAQQAQQVSQQSADQIQPIAPAQKASAVSTWLNRVLIVAILIAIPLLYHFGYIGTVWLNRLGIILNFCAGFMVAPELLGTVRLEKFEKALEDKAQEYLF
jgi:hypothetical protein